MAWGKVKESQTLGDCYRNSNQFKFYIFMMVVGGYNQRHGIKRENFMIQSHSGTDNEERRREIFI